MCDGGRKFENFWTKIRRNGGRKINGRRFEWNREKENKRTGLEFFFNEKKSSEEEEVEKERKI